MSDSWCAVSYWSYTLITISLIPGSMSVDTRKSPDGSRVIASLLRKIFETRCVVPEIVRKLSSCELPFSGELIMISGPRTRPRILCRTKSTPRLRSPRKKMLIIMRRKIIPLSILLQKDTEIESYVRRNTRKHSHHSNHSQWHRLQIRPRFHLPAGLMHRCLPVG